MCGLRKHKAGCHMVIVLSSVAWLGLCGCGGQATPVDKKPAAQPPQFPAARSVQPDPQTPADDRNQLIAKLKELGSQVNVEGDRVVGFGGPKVTDDGLANIRGLTSVRLLQLKSPTPV